MSANKVRGVSAALCCNMLPALPSHEHNNSNVLDTGAWLFGKYADGGMIRAFK